MTIQEKDKQYIANTYDRCDVEFTRGEGSILFDANGNRYIDFSSGIAVNGLGHGNKLWVEAVSRQAATLAHTSNLYFSEPCTMLAEMLCARTGMKKIFFANSGAEANECAIKTARKWAVDSKKTKSPRIITLQNSFHGRTLATLSATGQKTLHNAGFAPFVGGFDYVVANDITALKSAVTSDTCAVMLELVQGEGGVCPLDKKYVKEVEALCRKEDMLLIIDEVQTGNGRCGALYAYMIYNILPDIITTAKGLGNGLPIGACMFNASTETVLSYGDHGSTFGANLVACAGAISVLSQIDDVLLANVNSAHDYIISELSDVKKIKSITGLGLMLGIEVDNAKAVLKECLKQRLVVLTAHDKIRLLPPLNISMRDLASGIEILKSVLN